MAKLKNRIDGKSETGKRVLGILDVFEWALSKARPHLERMQDIQNVYDNEVDSGAYNTTANLSAPQVFQTVESQLAGAMERLFPRYKFLRLNPVNFGVNMEAIRNSELALMHTIKYRVNLAYTALETLKDCLKLGIGYGIVEPITITPPEVYSNQIISGGEVIARSRVMQPGPPKQSLRYKYASPGQVIVTPDGNSFNGANRVSTAFYLDTYSEFQFRNMFKDEATDGDSTKLTGDPEAIIQEARSIGFNPRVPIEDIIESLGGANLREARKQKRAIPVMVPVLKVYEEGRHTWVANGTTIVFDAESKMETMRCPLQKASAQRDGMRWYPMAPIEASYKMAIGSNIWTSAMFDLLSQYVRPELLYDKSKFPNGAPERGPSGEIPVMGNTTGAAEYMQLPSVPAQMLTFGDVLERLYSMGVGHNEALRNPQPGLMRSGPFAFESLLQTTSGRDRLASAVLQAGWLTSTIEQILLMMQTNITSDGDQFALRDWDENTGEEYVRELTITQSDLVNAYDLEIDLDAKRDDSAATQMQKQSEFQILKDDPYIDAWELRNDYLGEQERSKRLLKPREEVRRIQEEERTAQLEARANGSEQQGGGVLEQQLAGAGAAALGGGVG